MRAQVREFFLFVLAVAAPASCGSGGTLGTYTATYPPAASGGAAIPISLIDQGGVVTGLAVVPDHPAEQGVEAVPGIPTSLRVTWLAGGCVDRVAMVLNPVGDGYQITIHNHEGITAVACSPEIIPHTVDVAFKSVLEPASLSLNVQYP